jgi:hypothetical protein
MHLCMSCISSYRTFPSVPRCHEAMRMRSPSIRPHSYDACTCLHICTGRSICLIRTVHTCGMHTSSCLAWCITTSIVHCGVYHTMLYVARIAINAPVSHSRMLALHSSNTHSYIRTCIHLHDVHSHPMHMHHASRPC